MNKNTSTCIYTSSLDELNINQFISHYISLGFDHIFIREDPNSKFNIQYFIKKEYVSSTTVLRFETGSQSSDTKYFIDNFLSKTEYEYCLFIDADEFLYLKNYDTIQEFLSDGYNEYDTICFRWVLFGHGFVENQSIYDSIIDNFQYSECTISPSTHTMKCMIRSKLLINNLIWSAKNNEYIFANHIFTDYIHFENRAYYPDSKNIILPNNSNLDPMEADFFLAHYITQSLNYYLTRKSNRVKHGSWKSDADNDNRSREKYKTEIKYISSTFIQSNMIINHKMIEKYGNSNKKIEKFNEDYFLTPYIDHNFNGNFLTITEKNRKILYDLLNIPNDFDYDLYLKINTDVLYQYEKLNLYKNILESIAIFHFLNNGYTEGRIYSLKNIPSNFDWEKYLSLNSDLKKNGITNEIKAKVHYLRYGMVESRHYCDETP